MFVAAMFAVMWINILYKPRWQRQWADLGDVSATIGNVDLYISTVFDRATSSHLQRGSRGVLQYLT